LYSDKFTQLPKHAFYTVFQKNSQNCLSHNFVKFSPTLPIFGKKMAKTIKLCKVNLLSTSPNLCQHTTMWNTDVLNCYISRWLTIICIRFLTFASSIQHRAPC